MAVEVPAPYRLREVSHGDGPELEAVRTLFRGLHELLGSLGCDVSSFQSFELELEAMPAMYAPKKGGRLWLLTTTADVDSVRDGAAATADAPAAAASPPRTSKRLAAHPTLILGGGAERAVACVAFKRIDEATAEMKRLFVLERGKGHAKMLMRVAVQQAAVDGYKRMVLDTLERLPWARRLFESAGFKPVEPYCHNPMPDALFFGQSLVGTAAAAPPPAAAAAGAGAADGAADGAGRGSASEAKTTA